MIASSVVSCTGLGLLTTLAPHSGSNKWIGYQTMVGRNQRLSFHLSFFYIMDITLTGIPQAGIGIGLGLQLPLIVVQTVLPLSQVPIGSALMYFLQSIGGAIFVSIGQNVFANRLAQDLAKNIPELDPKIILKSGATSLQQNVPPENFPLVQLAYNNGVTLAFLVAAVMAGLTIIGALAVQWKNVKNTHNTGARQRMTDSETTDHINNNAAKDQVMHYNNSAA